MWRSNLDSFLADLKGIPSSVNRNRAGAPASIAEVELLEAAAKAPLPKQFRRFLLTEASAIEIDWRLADGVQTQLAGERESISYGTFCFNLSELVDINPQWSPDYEMDDYDRKLWPAPLLCFASVPNGDAFGVVLTGEHADSIRYLSHDLEDIHFYKVADDMFSFLENFAALGFAGPEYWIWEQFTNGRTTPIDSKSTNAREFRRMLRGGVRSAKAEALYRRADEAMRIVNFKMSVLPKAQRLLENKKFDAFVAALADHVDLLEGHIKARYEYHRKNR